MKPPKNKHPISDLAFSVLWNSSGIEAKDLASICGVERAIIYRRRRKLGLSERAMFSVEYVRELEKRAGQKA